MRARGCSWLWAALACLLAAAAQLPAAAAIDAKCSACEAIAVRPRAGCSVAAATWAGVAAAAPPPRRARSPTL